MSATPNPNPTPNTEEDKKPNDIAHINLKVKGQVRFLFHDR
jgi:hypothetical protein